MLAADLGDVRYRINPYTCQQRLGHQSGGLRRAELVVLMSLTIQEINVNRFHLKNRKFTSFSNSSCPAAGKQRESSAPLASPDDVAKHLVFTVFLLGG